MTTGNVVDKRGSREVSNTNLRRVAASTERTPARAVFSFDTLEDAFPVGDPGLIPFGSDVLVQLRTPRTVSKGGIIVPDEARETDQWNTQVAKVIACGPVCFCNRETLEPWPEGAWAKVGEYVRVPKYGGDRWWVDTKGGADKKALFVLFNDMDLKGRVPDDKVLDMVAYIL